MPAIGYSELIERCLDPLFRTALRLTGGVAAAEDLVQETCLRAHRAWLQLRDPSGGQAWLFRILHTTWLDELRKSTRRPRLVAMVHDTSHSAADTAPLPDVTDADERRQLEQSFDQEVLTAMNELPEDERLALIFQVFGGLSYREIGDALGCPLGTVMSRLHRAKMRLRERLAEYAMREGIIRRVRSTQEKRGHAQA
jgi:RNA polymerase sigma-70 factor, ECF subfamily